MIWIAGLMLIGIGCEDAAPPLAPPVVAAEEPPTAPAPAPEPEVPPEPLVWQWSPEPMRYPSAPLQAEDIWLHPASADSKPLRLERRGEAGGWSVEVPFDFVVARLDGAAMVVDAERIFVVHFHQIATGAELCALDRESGALLWRERLQGLGSIAHSRYRNEVQLRLIDGDPVVYGRESAGRYIERRDAQTGALRTNEVLPRE